MEPQNEPPSRFGAPASAHVRGVAASPLDEEDDDSPPDEEETPPDDDDRPPEEDDELAGLPEEDDLPPDEVPTLESSSSAGVSSLEHAPNVASSRQVERVVKPNQRSEVIELS